MSLIEPSLKNVEVNTIQIPVALYKKLKYLGLMHAETRNTNVGASNYAEHFIQPWTVWLDYPELTAWDHDIVKRVLRTKIEPGLSDAASRIMDYKKIIHDCEERVRQLKETMEDM